MTKILGCNITFKYFVALFGIMALSVPSYAGPVCSNIFEENVSVEKVVEDISKLPPLILDLSNPREAIQKLIEEITELRSDFLSLRQIKEILADPNADLNQIHSLLDKLINDYARDARSLLDSKSGFSEKERKLLEGYRILIKIAQSLKQQAENKQEEQKKQNGQPQDGQQNKDKQNQERQDNQGQQAENQKEYENDPEKQENQKQEQNSQENQKQQEDNKQDSQESNSEKNKQKDQENQDSNEQDSELNKDIKNLKKKLDELKQEQQKQEDQKQKEKQKKEQEQQEKNAEKEKQKQKDKDSKGQNSEKSKESDKQKDKDESSDPSEQQGQGEKEGDSKDGKSGEGQQGQEGKGDQSGEPSGQKSKPGQQSGKESGQTKLDKDLLSKLKDILRTMKEEKDKNKNQRDEKANEPEKQSNDSEKPKFDYKKEKDKLDQWKPPNSKDKKNKKPENKDNNKPEKLTDLEKMELIKTQLNYIWSEVLRKYESHESLMSAIADFRNACQKLRSANPFMDFIDQFEMKVSDFFEKLDTYQVQYKSLEQLGLSMLSSLGGDKQNLERKLQFLNEVFTELEKNTTLTNEEEHTVRMVRQLLGFLDATKKSVTDKQLSEAFISQMMGPLSRRVLKRNYPSKNAKEDLDWTGLAKDIRSGLLNDLVLYSRMKSFLNIFNKQIQKPKNEKRNEGPKVPINEANPDLELAQELDRAQFFYRDGAPISEDLLRILSGDMLENTYYDEVTRANPKKPIPKIVTIVVYDVSGSMAQENKYIIRNALASGYIDRSQTDVVLGKAEHVIYLVAFENEAHPAVRVGSVEQAQKQFELNRGQVQTGGGGTSITNALVSVYEQIAEHQKKSGELDRANILLITDAEDTISFSQIEAARKKINPDVEIVMNAITMGAQMNAQIADLVKTQGGEGEGKLGRVAHQHLDHNKITRILNTPERIKEIEEQARAFDSSGDKTFSNQDLLKLKNQLSIMESKAEVRDRSLANFEKSFLKRLAESSSKPNSESDAENKIQLELDKEMEIFFSLVNGSVSQGWSPPKKAYVLSLYIEKLAQVYKTEENVIFESLTDKTKKNLHAWIK